MGQFSMEITRSPGSVLGGNQHSEAVLSSAPASIKALALTPGQETNRLVSYCASCRDAFENDVLAAAYHWVTHVGYLHDPVLLDDRIAEHQEDSWHCELCGGSEPRSQSVSIRNSDALENLIVRLTEESLLPERAGAGRTNLPSRGPDRENMLHLPCCTSCGSWAIIRRGVAHRDPYTLSVSSPRIESPTAVCTACRSEDTTPEIRPLTSHAIIHSTVLRVEIARKRKTELQAIMDWLSIHGHHLGLSPHDISRFEAIRAEEMRVCLPV